MKTRSAGGGGSTAAAERGGTGERGGGGGRPPPIRPVPGAQSKSAPGSEIAPSRRRSREWIGMQVLDRSPSAGSYERQGTGDRGQADGLWVRLELGLAGRERGRLAL